MHTQSWVRKKSRGQSLVEVALMLPVVLIVMLGLLDLGRAFYMLVALNDAADEGASYAAISPGDALGIRSRAAASSTALMALNLEDVFVTYSPGGIAVWEPVTVTVRVQMDIFTPFVSSLLPDNELWLQGQSVHIIRSQ